jgi:hypothetical protein
MQLQVWLGLVPAGPFQLLRVWVLVLCRWSQILMSVESLWRCLLSPVLVCILHHSFSTYLVVISRSVILLDACAMGLWVSSDYVYYLLWTSEHDWLWKGCSLIQYVASFQDSKWHEIYMDFNFRVLGLQEQNHLKVVAVIMTIVLLVVLLITLILLRRVIIAVAVIKVQML